MAPQLSLDEFVPAVSARWLLHITISGKSGLERDYMNRASIY
jgi:hypothetical protein